MNSTTLTIAESIRLEQLLEREEYLTDELKDKIRNSLGIYARYSNEPLALNFSGGKDSTVLVLLGLLLESLSNGARQLDASIVMADTHLEAPSLMEYVSDFNAFLAGFGKEIEYVSASHSYFVYQFAYGYAVPRYNSRWCTSRLKVDPLQKATRKRTVFTGRHLGESQSRDNRLMSKQCGGDTCGSDLLKDKVEPILDWGNDDVWMALMWFSETEVFTDELFNQIGSLYDVTTSVQTKAGSLRMGCIFCPVISPKTLEQSRELLFKEDVFLNVLRCREILTELETNGKRVNSIIPNKNGAYHIEDRRYYWNLFKRDCLELFLGMHWITQDDVNQIDLALESDYSYPPRYKKEHIEEQHRIHQSYVSTL